MKVLMVTTEWPTPENPFRVPFLKRQVDLLRSRGIEVEVYFFEGKKNPLNYLRACISVRKLVRKGNFNIIHAQWGQSALPVWGIDLPLVISFRGSDLFGITKKNGIYSWKGKLLKVISRFMARKADHLILVSASMLSHLPKSVAHKTSIIPTGVDLDLFKPMSKSKCRQRLGMSEDEKVVLFGGDPLRTDKRFHLAQEAVKILQTRHSVKLLFVKNVPHDQMPVYINAADVVLLTSKHEGSPNIVKEALACNIPVVSVDVGDVKERFHLASGCKLTTDTPQAIADSLEEILNSPDLYELRHAVLELNEYTITDKVIDIYRRVCA